MSVSLYDTLTRSVKPLIPGEGGEFKFYSCGPTVYGPAHIGNFRTFLAQDVLRRVMEVDGYTVKHVRNITNVDDKTIRESTNNGTSLAEFTKRWTESFHKDCHDLNLQPPHAEPGAVEHIPQQVEMIRQLLKKNHAYEKDGSVYFRVSSFPEYGALSRLKERQVTTTQHFPEPQGPEDADEYIRESGADFALWKNYKPEDGDNKWELLGKTWGRPGWHLECSAMCREHLGDTLDLHSGGEDLIFPHHENEIAQSEAATGQAFCRHWFHISHLMVEGQKMSKSLKNMYTLEDIRAKGFSAMELRYVLISGSYRQPLNFTFDSLTAARSALNKLTKFAAQLPGLPIFNKQEGPAVFSYFKSAWEALADDLNVPKALGQIFGGLDALSEKVKGDSAAALIVAKEFSEILYALGFDLSTQKQPETKVSVPQDIQKLAQERWDAKQSKNFQRSDEIRKDLQAKGWLIKDSKDGFEVVPVV
ncbi:MAG: cysteine--tRNA ligase [Verrucomicrobiota bacterium]|nr:cysteine--tRNA ligase [Verrucomicrobiota bacterium]